MKQMYIFLTCHGEYPLEYREFAFGEYYRRYDSKKLPLRFKTMIEWINYCVQENVSSVVAGPLFYPNVAKEDKYVLYQRPLFFDIDLDDYHMEHSKNRPAHISRILRSCPCKPGMCCDICWKEIAVKPLKEMIQFLTDIMEYEHIIPIYSGSRGFWVIVWDKEVWNYDNVARENILNRMNVCFDRMVTIQSTHLMKIPFTPHKKTGILSIPIEDPDVFLPSHAPHYMDSEKEKLNVLANKYFFSNYEG
jgi:DNA primase catalytic subunit